MSKPPLPTATVALIAVQMLGNLEKSGALGTLGFSGHEIPGSGDMTYRRSAMLKAAKMAWELCEAIEDTRPSEIPKGREV